MNLHQQDTRAAGTTAAVTRLTLLPVLPITIGAGQAVAHRGWIAAREAALTAVRTGPCVVAVAGAPGTGKTLLLEELARVLGQSGIATTMHRRGDLDEDETADARDAAAASRVVLIDEADRLEPAALARLATENGFGLVLARKHLPADGETDPLCEAASGGRPISFVRLAPLLPGETGAFIHERLARAGYLRAGHSGTVIGEAAIAEIERFSGRVPRLVNMLASAALFLAASNDAAQVDAEHVAEAAALRGLSAPAEPEEPTTSDSAPPDAGEPASISAAVAPAATEAKVAVIPLDLPEQASIASEPAPLPDPTSADRLPLILPAAEAARVLMARNTAALPLQAPRSASTRRPLVRRAAILALCTVAGGAAAAGWLASRETGSAAARLSGQSARAGTNSALAGPAGAASAVARATPPPAAAAAPTPVVAEPPPDGSKLASTALPPPPSGTPTLPSAPRAVESTSARSTPAVSTPPPAAAREQDSTPTGPRSEPKGVDLPSYAANEPAQAPTASPAPRQSGPSAHPGTTSALPQPSQGGPAAPLAVAAAKPPPANIAPSVPAAAEPQSVESKSAAAPAPRTPASAAAPAATPQRLASSDAKAAPVVRNAASSPAQPSHLATFVPPLPPTPAPAQTPAQTFAQTGPRPAPNTREAADRFPAYATDGQTRTPNASFAGAGHSTSAWGPLSLDDLRRYGSPPGRASRRAAGPTPDVLGSVPARPENSAPPESRAAPQRYVGVYVTQPDGRRTFISAQ